MWDKGIADCGFEIDEVSVFSVQVSDSLSVFPDTRNLTPETLSFGARDMRFGLSTSSMAIVMQ
jgi:hypothetical protein